MINEADLFKAFLVAVATHGSPPDEGQMVVKSFSEELLRSIPIEDLDVRAYYHAPSMTYRLAIEHMEHPRRSTVEEVEANIMAALGVIKYPKP